MALAAACAAAAAVPVTAAAQDGGGSNGQQTQDRQAVVQRIAQGNQLEIVTGRLAVQRGRSSAVRRLGRLLVRHHTRAQQQLAAVAQDLALELPAAGDVGPPTADVARLQRSSRRSFDRRFARLQVRAHRASITLHLGVALGTDDEQGAALRELAIRSLPLLGEHLGWAEAILARSGGSGNGSNSGSASAHH